MWPTRPDRPVTVVAVGECMLELRHRTEVALDLDVAGDTYNAAVYLRRAADSLGVHTDVGYLTGLGDDPYSAHMRATWARHGVRDRAVTIPGGQPGLYAVRTDSAGERSFVYWRDSSAARTLFQRVDWLEAVGDPDVVHFSGVTLQLMSPEVRTRFLSVLDELRSNGSVVSFDTNYRPSGWAQARDAIEAFTAAATVSTLVLATFDDDRLLFADAGPERTLARYLHHGAEEVVVKLGPRGALLSTGCEPVHVEATAVPHVVDTTAAGDSFAGAYLAGRLAGMSPLDAAGLGAEMAAVVIQSPGAIIART